MCCSAPLADRDGRQERRYRKITAVLEYTAERIVVAVPRGKVCLDGTGLRLKAMNKNELLVGGRIRNIEGVSL